jgi:type IV secretion system protein VirD4
MFGWLKSLVGGAGGVEQYGPAYHAAPRAGPFVGLVQESGDQFSRRHYAGDGHLLMVAPSRSGKARDVLVRSLLTNTDSAVVVDVAGELASITLRARQEMGHEVHVLNPFARPQGVPAERGWPASRFNPLMAIDPDSRSAHFTSDIEALAAALIAVDAGKDAHWDNSARAMLVGLIAHEVVTQGRDGAVQVDAEAVGDNVHVLRRGARPKADAPSVPSLANVRAKLCESDTSFEQTVGAILERNTTTVVRERLNAFSVVSRELSSVRSTARTQTTWLDDMAMRVAIEGNDFSFADMKRKAVTVYLILPAQLIAGGMTYSRYLRLMLQSALEALARTPKLKERNRPVWFLIDEFYSLGAMPIIERMMSEGAKYGVQLQPIVQNIGQLQELYGKNWETFVANAAVRQFFAPRDLATAEYVSKLMGQETVYAQSISAQGDVSLSETGRAVLRPEEVMQLPDHRQVIFDGGAPWIGWRLPYYDPRWGLQGRYDTNPYYVG